LEQAKVERRLRGPMQSANEVRLRRTPHPNPSTSREYTGTPEYRAREKARARDALRKQLSAEGGLGEVAADAGGGLGGLDHQHVRAGDVQFALQRADELSEPADLRRRGNGLVEIA